MAFQTPEEEGVLVPAEEPVIPESAPTAPEYVPVEPAPSPVPATPEEPVSEPVPSASANPAVPEDLVTPVQELVNRAFTEGVPAAVAEARKTGNAALVDALHAALSEPAMHDALQSRGKLSAD